jgi:glycosyltransferase involved in cell wall biosynthesis
MKVVYVSTIERGGPLTHLRQLVPRVAAEGVDVHVLAGNEALAESFRALGVPAEAVSVGHKLDVRGGTGLWRKLQSADVVHTHDRRAGLFGRLAGRLRGARVVHTLHGMPEEIAARIGRPEAPDPPGVSRGRLAWLEHGYLPIEAGLTRLGHVVAPSQAMADFMVEHGFSPQLLHVIPYGIELEEAAPGQEDDRLVAGVAANLEYWKGIDVLIEAALPGLRRYRQWLRCTAPVRAWRPWLGRRARWASTRASTGLRAEIRPRLAELPTCSVQPSRADNLPLAILEAMAIGLPVIGARVGGIPELVLDGETGVVVPAEDPVALAAALDSLASSPERRRELGAAGRKRAAEHFSAEGVARRSVALYEELCASST